LVIIFLGKVGSRGIAEKKQGEVEVITAAAAYTLMPRWMEKTNRAGYRELT